MPRPYYFYLNCLIKLQFAKFTTSLAMVFEETPQIIIRRGEIFSLLASKDPLINGRNYVSSENSRDDFRSDISTQLSDLLFDAVTIYQTVDRQCIVFVDAIKRAHILVDRPLVMDELRDLECALNEFFTT